MSENEFVELLWENGQIVMQSQPNRPKNNFFPTSFTASDNRVQDKDSRGVIMPKFAQFGSTDEIFKDVPGPSSNMSPNAQNDDSVPWIHHPVDDSLPDDSLPDDDFSVFFSEFSGTNLHRLSSHSSILPSCGNSFLGHTDTSSNSMEHLHAPKALAGSSDSGRIRGSQLFELPQKCQSSIPAISSIRTDLRNGDQVDTQQGKSGDLLSTRLQKEDVPVCKPLQLGNSLGSMNFSHFSRPITLLKANLNNIERLRSNEEAAASANVNKDVESTIIQSASGFKSVSGIQEKLAALSSEKELRSSANISPEIVSIEKMQDIHQQEIPSKDDNNNNVANGHSIVTDHANKQSSNFEAGNMTLGRHETEKGPEAVVASSSLCSGNSGGAGSNDSKHRSKRKHQEGEDSDIHSEDLEDESVSLKRPAIIRGTNTKRSRAAEVHNLSERRRRDRINEKMRALQELIPNCNKVDKASMLDEAIEYLKTLQLQVQMMTMGSGLCMPPVMLLPGMQQMHMSPMAHLSQMGVGMGLGYGMGMLDMNGSPGYPFIPIPPLHGTGAQFPCPTIPGAQGSNAMPGSTRFPIYGIPGQGIPSPVPCLPPFGYLSGLPMKANLGPEITATIPASVTMSPSSYNNQKLQNLNVEIIPPKTGAGDSLIQTDAQG